MEEKNNIQIAIEAFGHRHPEVKLEKSTISDQDIVGLENKLHVTIPAAVKDYFQSYIFSVPFITGKLLGDFSQTYCEETGRWREMEIEEEVSTRILQLPFMFPNSDLREFERENEIFIGTGFLYLGLYDEEKYVLLDLQTEQVYQMDMARVRPTSKEETRADILKWALPFFQSFEDLARCFFAGELYDEEEMTFQEKGEQK